MKKKKAIIAAIAIAACIGGTSFAVMRYNESRERSAAPQQTQHSEPEGRDDMRDTYRPMSDTTSRDGTKEEPKDNDNAKSETVETPSHATASSGNSYVAAAPRSAQGPTHRNNTPVQRVGNIQQVTKPAANSHSSQTTTPGSTPTPSQPSTPAPSTPPAQPPATQPSTPPSTPGQPQPQPPVVTPPAPTPQPPVDPPAPQPPVVNPPAPTPQPPVNPPAPQPPVVTPPTTPETDEEKAKKLAESLKTAQNNNTAYFVNHDSQHRVALWTKGITAPRLGKGGDLVHKIDGGYSYDYLPFNDQARHMGWFDADKAPQYSIADINLCFAAVSANQLHWWMAQNKQHIDQYLAKINYGANLPGNLVGGLRDLRTYQNSFKNQQNSAFFTMFKAYFGYNRDGYQVDPLNDLFINGYKPKPSGGVNEENWPLEFEKDDRGGFFHDVFGRKLLTDRLTTQNFDYFAKQVKLALQQGKSVGVIYTKGGGYSHVITAWGAEFDQNGKLTALYITDSDDVEEEYNGLRRMGVKNIDGRAALSNNLNDPRHGSKVDSITTLSLGDAQWKEFLK